MLHAFLDKFKTNYFINGYFTLLFLFACFQKFTQTKSIDWQALVGNVGGYVGLCLGYALLQIPSFIRGLFEKCKSAMETKRTVRQSRIVEKESTTQKSVIELQV